MSALTTVSTLVQNVAKRARTSRKPGFTLDLALQGGGSHGAYTWGVLDRLLEEQDLTIAGISGTSAGAMNGAVLVTGYAQGGAQGARDALDAYWLDVSKVGSSTSLLQTPWEKMTHGWNLDQSMMYRWAELVTHASSPYDWNPLNINPLRAVVEKHTHIEALQNSPIQLFIAATHVQSGQAKVFTGSQLSVDAILASACLPYMYQAIEIDGEAYWDGGYMGNPVLWPLIYNTVTADLMLVQINPLYRSGVPKTAQDIANRLNEISFNSGLIAELRAIDFVKQLLADKKVDRQRYKDMHLHVVQAHTQMAGLDASSKANTDRAFLLHLKQIGRDVTQAWLETHKGSIGKRSTVDIKSMFLNPHGTIAS